MTYLSNPQKRLAFALAGLMVLPAPMPLAAQSMNVVDLSMTIGKSLVIDYPVEIGRISTSSPEVVDAVPATAKEFLLHGKGHGSATVVVWSKTGARTMYNAISSPFASSSAKLSLLKTSASRAVATRSPLSVKFQAKMLPIAPLPSLLPSPRP